MWFLDDKYKFHLQFTPLSNGEKTLENRLVFHKVITISWVVHFSETQYRCLDTRVIHV